MAARATNLDIVVDACEFWSQLKESLMDASRNNCDDDDDGGSAAASKMLQQIDGQTPLCKGYLDLCAILHQQCKRLQRAETLSSGTVVTLEIDGDEQRELKGMSVANFRDVQEDFFL